MTTTPDPRLGGRRRFGLQVVVSGSAQAGRAIQQFVILVVITKLLGAEPYGVWSQVAVTIGLLSPLGMLLLEPAMVRFLPEAGDQRRERQLLLRFGLLTLGGSAVIGAVLLLVAAPLLRLVADGEAALPYVRLIAAMIAAEGLIVLVLAFWRARGRIGRFAAASLGRDLGSAAVISAIGLGGGDVRAVLTGYVVYSWIYALVVFLLSALRRGWPGVTMSGAARQIRFVGPLVLNHPLGWAGKYANVYVISLLLGAGSVGVYSSARHLTDVLGLLSGPILLVLAPALAKLYVRGEMGEVRDYMTGAISYYLLGALPLAAAVTIYAEPVLRLVSSGAIAVSGAPLVPWLASAMVFMGTYSILAESAYLTRRTWFFPPVWTLLAVAQITLNLVLVPRLGLLGSAVAECAGAAVVLCCGAGLAHRALGLRPDILEAVKLVGAALLAFALTVVIDAQRTGGGLAVFAGVYLAALAALRVHTFRRLFQRTLKMSGRIPRPAEVQHRP